MIRSPGLLAKAVVRSTTGYPFSMDANKLSKLFNGASRFGFNTRRI
jgi:hypothetical protein